MDETEVLEPAAFDEGSVGLEAERRETVAGRRERQNGRGLETREGETPQVGETGPAQRDFEDIVSSVGGDDIVGGLCSEPRVGGLENRLGDGVPNEVIPPKSRLADIGQPLFRELCAAPTSNLPSDQRVFASPLFTGVDSLLRWLAQAWPGVSTYSGGPPEARAKRYRR